MARDDSKKVILQGQEAIDLWLKGKDAWNEWVEENPVADVNFSGVKFFELRESCFHQVINFRKFNFPKGKVNFRYAEFGDGNVDFSGTKFGDGEVDFSSTKFGAGNIDFSDSKFGEGKVTFDFTEFGKGDVNFDEVDFRKGDISFKFCEFQSGDISFNDTTFNQGAVFFYLSKFSKCDILFLDTQFNSDQLYFSHINIENGTLAFVGADFNVNHVHFDSLNIKGKFLFTEVQNSQSINYLSFKNSTFDGPVNLKGNQFNCIPDFTNTKLSHHLNLSDFNIKPNMVNSGKFLGLLNKTSIKDEDDIDRIRRLKELAEDNKHHSLALDLHVEEMRSKRWTQTTSKRTLFVELLFKILGDYGRSVQAPILWFMGICAFFTPIYYFNSTAKFPYWSEALLYSLSQMLYLLPTSRTGRTELAKQLFTSTEDIPNIVFFASWCQSLISIILIFLLGLTLRNRFRI